MTDLHDLLREMGIDGDECHYLMEDMIAIGGDMTSVTTLPSHATHVTSVTHSPTHRECDERHTHPLDMDTIANDRLTTGGKT